MSFYGITSIFFSFLHRFEQYSAYLIILMKTNASIVLNVLNVFFVLSANSSFASDNINVSMDISTWSYKGSNFECNLIHSTIPHGKFYFRSEAGGKNLFIADIVDNNRWDKVVLESKSAPWEKEIFINKKASHTLTEPKHRFAFSSGIDSLLDDMMLGRWVVLSLRGSHPSTIKSITLPALQIQQALHSFNQCRDKLPKLSFAQARDLTIPFQFGQKKLQLSQKNTLADLYSYVVVDERITTILVDGHADNIGDQFANLNVSRQRADQVAKALVNLGVERNMIEVRAHGARYPIASNNTSVGQAKNRRVTLRLVRDDEHVTAENKSEIKPTTQQYRVKAQ